MIKIMIRILHIVGLMNKGGTETMLMNIYRKINRKEIQFDFLVYGQEDGYYDEEIKSLGGNIIKVNVTKGVGIKKSIDYMLNAISRYGIYKAVHAHTLFNSGIAMIAARKNHISIRISHSHTTSDNEEGIKRKIYIVMMRYLINKNATKLLACSNEAGKYMFGNRAINSEKYSYFQNLIDYDSILNYSKELVNQFKLQNKLNKSIVIGHVGTFKEAKNQKFLLEITKFLKEKNYNVKLLLVGDGEMRSELENIINKYDISENVILPGIRDDVNNLLHCMDVFVFPSKYEGLGLVLLEAQVAGLPCIVSEAIQNEADLNLGLLHRLNLSDGIEIWANKILELKDLPKLNYKNIEQALDKNGYSTEKCISKLREIYEV